MKFNFIQNNTETGVRGENMNFVLAEKDIKSHIDFGAHIEKYSNEIKYLIVNWLCDIFYKEQIKIDFKAKKTYSISEIEEAPIDEDLRKIITDSFLFFRDEFEHIRSNNHSIHVLAGLNDADVNLYIGRLKKVINSHSD